MIDFKAKAIRCSLRKTHPIGPITLCKGISCFELCIDVSLVDIAEGKNEIKGPYRTANINYDGRKRCCLFCGKSIAKPETPDWSFKGMFAIHLKYKHPESYEAYKRKELKLSDLYYLKSL